MKILMLSNEFPPSLGGVQTHVYELSRALVLLGHQVQVITRRHNRSWSPREVLDGITVHRLRLPDNHLLYDWTLRRYIRKLHRSEPIDCIHVHGMRPLKAAKHLGIPLIFTNHTSGFLRRARQGSSTLEKMRRQLEGCDLVLAPSQELVDATILTGHPGPYQFIANGVDTDKFSPGPSTLRAQLGIPDNAFVAILARRLVEKNGVLFLASALAEIHAEDFHLVVAGDGADREAFQTLVSQAPCANRVHMLGGVSNERMPEVFRSGDVSILPSLMEATSIAGLEAMACGLALIGTNVGGIPVILTSDQTGLLVPASDSSALAGAVNTLLNDRVKAAEMGRQGLAKVRASFSWQCIAQCTLNAYNECSTESS